MNLANTWNTSTHNAKRIIQIQKKSMKLRKIDWTEANQSRCCPVYVLCLTSEFSRFIFTVLSRVLRLWKMREFCQRQERDFLGNHSRARFFPIFSSFQGSSLSKFRLEKISHYVDRNNILRFCRRIFFPWLLNWFLMLRLIKVEHFFKKKTLSK